MDYDQPFELQKQQMVQDDGGSVSVEWATVYRGYARMSSLGSTEFWQAAAVQAQDTVKLFTRFHPVFGEVDTRDTRILWRGKYLDITSIENVNFRNEQIVMRAVFRDE